jgi:hypothetical protein
MPIETIQKRLPEIGRLRLGGPKRKNRPGEPLDTFRFTSQSEKVAQAAANVYGGTVEPFNDALSEDKFQVIFEKRMINVLIPPENAQTSWFEMWSRGVLDRRCDGITVNVTKDSPDGPIDVEQPCLCTNLPERECKPRSRFNFILSGIPLTGTVLLQTGGYNAAAEVVPVVEAVENSGATMPVPATLWIVNKTDKSRKHGTRHYKTPLLNVIGGVEALLPAPDKQRTIDGETGEIKKLEDSQSEPNEVRVEAEGLPV